MRSNVPMFLFFLLVLVRVGKFLFDFRTGGFVSVLVPIKGQQRAEMVGVGRAEMSRIAP